MGLWTIPFSSDSILLFDSFSCSFRSSICSVYELISCLNEVLILSSICARSFVWTTSFFIVWTADSASFSWDMFCVNSSMSFCSSTWDFVCWSFRLVYSRSFFLMYFFTASIIICISSMSLRIRAKDVFIFVLISFVVLFRVFSIWFFIVFVCVFVILNIVVVGRFKYLEGCFSV